MPEHNPRSFVFVEGKRTVVLHAQGVSSWQTDCHCTACEPMKDWLYYNLAKEVMWTPIDDKQLR